jgi:Lon protease-like protein
MPRLSPGWQVDYAGAPPFEDVCALALVRHIRSIDAGQYLISVEGLVRCRLEEVSSPHAFRQARPIAQGEPACGLAESQVRTEVDLLCQGLRTVSKRLQAPLELLESLLREASSPFHLLDRLGCLLVENPDARQAFLECESVEGRLKMLRELVSSALSLGGQAGLRPSEN